MITQTAAQALLDLVVEIPEFMIFGAWDTPRCLWCKGKQREGGHKPNCHRQCVLAAVAKNQRQEFLPGLEEAPNG